MILSIETSGTTCSISISEKENTLLTYSLNGKNLHDKMLAELVSRSLVDIGVKVHELDAVAVSSGPGSFTGLRIGGSFAKGLCFNNKPKLISVPTLDAIGEYYSNYAIIINKEYLIPMIPSFKGNYYYKIFDIKGNDTVGIIHDDLDSIRQYKDYLVVGPGTPEYERSKGIDLYSLNAEIISKTAFKYYQLNKFIDSEDFVPLYVSDFRPGPKRKELNI